MRIFEAVVKIKTKISALFLALMTLVSSSQFMVSAHFCGGDLKSFSLLTKADPCHTTKQVPPCHRSEKPCCEDLTTVHASDEFNSIAQIANLTVQDFTAIPSFEVNIPEVNYTSIVGPQHQPTLTPVHRPTFRFCIRYS